MFIDNMTRYRHKNYQKESLMVSLRQKESFMLKHYEVIMYKIKDYALLGKHKHSYLS